METTETMVIDYEDVNVINTGVQANTDEVTYAIEKATSDPNEERWAIRIESGLFKDFLFTINHMRLYVEDEEEDKSLVTDENMEELIDKDIQMDFEYDIKYVPATYKDSKLKVQAGPITYENNQTFFEAVARNILMDIVINYPELYSTEKE
jgi:hypothetical protein